VFRDYWPFQIRGAIGLKSVSIFTGARLSQESSKACSSFTWLVIVKRGFDPPPRRLHPRYFLGGEVICSRLAELGLLDTGEVCHASGCSLRRRLLPKHTPSTDLSYVFGARDKTSSYLIK